MSQTVITSAFEQLKAQQAVTGEAVVLDGFIFANVPNLDISSPIDPNEAIPPDAQIVHRADVALTGVVNDNAVVYSVTLGTAVGDFDFNWVGLVNKTSNVLAMIVHAPVQSKVANAAGVQGNVLTRSFLMEYDGAKKQTNITTPAQTWQIDFTARLDGIDERQRLENADIYGAAAFFGDGWLVGKTGNQFFVTKGTGYVAGLRTSLAENQNITVTTKPVKVWLDVCWTGALTSVWNAQSKITVAENLADYVQNGVQHYVFAVASIDVNGNITDLRPKGTLNEQQASDALKKHEQSRNHPDASTSEKGFAQLSSATDSASEELAATSKAVKIAMDNANARLAKERNGADIPNPQLFVQNIGLQDTVNKAAGALQKDQNLADIPDKAKARAALQLGTVATLDVTSSATDSTLGHVLKVGDRGLGLAVINYVGIDFNTYKFAAGETLFLRMADCTNIPAGIDTGYVVYAYVNVIGVRNVNNNVAVLIGDNGGAKYYWAVRSTNSSGVNTWSVRILPQTAADVGALPITGGALNGSLGIGVANALGGNSIVLGDNDTGFKQEGDGILNVYANSALVMRFIASLIESLKPLKVNGNCIATGEIQAANGAVRLAADGNIYGSMWGGWMMNYLTNTFQLKGQAYTKAESDARYIQSMRLGSAVSTTWWADGGDCPAGHVLTGGDFNSDKSYVRYKPVQVLINGKWVTISG